MPFIWKDRSAQSLDYILINIVLNAFLLDRSIIKTARWLITHVKLTFAAEKVINRLMVLFVQICNSRQIGRPIRSWLASYALFRNNDHQEQIFIVFYSIKVLVGCHIDRIFASNQILFTIWQDIGHGRHTMYCAASSVWKYMLPTGLILITLFYSNSSKRVHIMVTFGLRCSEIHSFLKTV